MEGIERKPFQGTYNIIRFNWHYYVLITILIIVLLYGSKFLPDMLHTATLLACLILVLITFISMAVSYYIYDYSGLYSFNWLNDIVKGQNKQLVNITAGFDETSTILSGKYSSSKVIALDFYDPAKHTEVSIKRARKAYPAFEHTQTVSTTNAGLQPNTVDYFTLIFAAHEIRDNKERVCFLKQLKDALKDDGRIIIAEHKRDYVNFLAYNIGTFHFLSNKTWISTFEKANLVIESETKINPFITLFILK